VYLQSADEMERGTDRVRYDSRHGSTKPDPIPGDSVGLFPANAGASGHAAAAAALGNACPAHYEGVVASRTGNESYAATSSTDGPDYDAAKDGDPSAVQAATQAGLALPGLRRALE
jgi:hypothetical protein